MRNGGRFDAGYTRRLDARYTRRLDARYIRRLDAGYARRPDAGNERHPNTGCEECCAFGLVSGAKMGAEMALVQGWPYSRAEE
jgi:hypothetical protein